METWHWAREPDVMLFPLLDMAEAVYRENSTFENHSR